MRFLRDIPVLENIPVLVRTSLNVPVQDGEVVNTYRLRRALPTIQFLTKQGARVILISHLGEDGTASLAPVAKAFSKLLPRVHFCPETTGPSARKAVRELLSGEVLILENLRRDAGEKGNSPMFARALAELADVFVEDSFDTCHRVHASIVALPHILPAYAGLQLEEEIRELTAARTPARPSLAVIGGAKFSTKEPVLMRLLESYDQVFVGGALANDFLKAAGHPVGSSLVSEDTTDIAHLLENKKLVLPVDSRVVSDRGQGSARIATLDDVRDDEMILDHGPGTDALLEELAAGAKTILWNGPLGMYEEGFVGSTDAFARAVAATRAHSVVGGGDTIASIEKLGLLSHFSFVSAGGGAMLDFLTKGSLPGIQALDK